MRASEFITEKWSQKYKNSINCSNPKGFSQKAHCAGRKKNESTENLEERKRKVKKVKRAAYGPGPYGYYGVFPGYSGDAGAGGDGGGIGESQRTGPAGQLKAKAKIDVKGTVLGSPEKSQKGLRGKLVGGSMEEGELIPYPSGTVKVDVDDVYDWYKLGMNISDLDDADPEDFGKGPPQTILAFGSEPMEHLYLKYLKKLGLTTHDIDENFADGKNPGRKGLAKRSGVNCKASVSTLRNVAKNSSGEKQRMAHWCANMKSGKKK